MRKRIGMVVGILAMGLFLLVGCGEKEKTAEELLSSVGLKTLPEVVGVEPIVINADEDGNGVIYAVGEQYEEIMAQYKEYLSKECGGEAMAGETVISNTWEKDGVSIYVTSDLLNNTGEKNEMELIEAIHVSVWEQE